MKRFTVLVAAGLAAACAESPSAPAPAGALDPVLAAARAPAGPAFAATSSVFVPISAAFFVPCAAGGVGEVVTLVGSLHVVSHLALNAAGGVVIRSHAQPQGVSGAGLVTGDKYQGTGVTQEITHVAAAGLPYTFTHVNNFRIIGQGPGNDWLVHVTSHVTVNANGVTTATVDNTSSECR